MRRVLPLEVNLCLDTESLRAAIMRINALTGPNQYQLVVNNDDRLMGTLTDGDIRRGLLAGISLEDPVSRCMNGSPVVGKMDDVAVNERLLATLQSPAPFLPILTEDGRIAEVLVRDTSDIGHVRALVMAGGFGRRLGARTLNRPKPLLQVQGKPILERIIGQLSSSGIAEIVIAAHYLSEQIEEFVENWSGDTPISIVREEKPLGTAGALGLIPDGADGPIIVSNGDVLTNLDFAALLEFHRRQFSDATIAAAQHQVTIPFGVVRYNDAGDFLGIDEKPTLSNFVSAGIYCLSAEVCSLVRPNEVIDMPDVLRRGREAGYSVQVFPLHEYWTDVGLPADLERANAEGAGDAADRTNNEIFEPWRKQSR